MERFTIVGALIAAVMAGMILLRRSSPLHLCVIALIMTALVGSFFPVLSHFVEPRSWRNVAQAAEPQVLSAQLEYLAFGGGLLLATICAWMFGLLAPLGSRPKVSATDSERGRDRIVPWVLVIAGAALYAAYVSKVGFATLMSRDDYAEKYLVSIGLGPLTLGINLMMLGVLWAESARSGSREVWIFRAIALAIGVWSIAFISVRTNFVILGLAYGWIACTRMRIELARLRLSLVFLLLAGYLGLEGFSLFRGATQEGGRADIAVELIGRHIEDSLGSIVGGSELSHPFLTTMEVQEYGREGELEGASYVDALPALLPLGLMPDRPKALSETFVQAQYGDLADRGGGAAFSIVAEAWWNFGAITGSLFIGWLLGLVLCGIEHAGALRPHGSIARLTPYFAFLVVIAHRSESAVILKQTVPIALPALLLVAMSEIVLQRGRSHHGERALPRGPNPPARALRES